MPPRLLDLSWCVLLLGSAGLLLPAEAAAQGAEAPRPLIAQAEISPSLETGFGHLYRGDLAEARRSFEQVQAAAKREGDRPLEAAALLGLSHTLGWQGDYREALALAQKGLAIYEDLGDEEGVAEAQQWMAEAYLNQDQIPEAIAAIEPSLAVWQARGDRLREGRVQGWLGVAQVKQGDPKKALETLQGAIAQLEALNLPPEQVSERQYYLAIFYVWQTSTYSQLQAASEAKVSLQKAQELAQELGHTPLMASGFLLEGILTEASDPAIALAAYQKGLALAENLEDQRTKATLLRSIGRLHSSQKRYDEAIAALERSLALWQQFDDPDTSKDLAWLRHDLGIAYYHAERYPEAIAAFQKAESVFRQKGDRAAQAGVLSLWGYALIWDGQFEAGRERFRQYQATVTALEDPQQQTQASLSIGQSYISEAQNLFTQGQFLEAIKVYDQALPYLEEALVRAKQTDQKRLAYHAIVGLSHAYAAQGHAWSTQSLHEKSLQAFQASLDFVEANRDWFPADELPAYKQTILGSLASSYRDNERQEEALKVYQESLAIAQQQGDRAAEFSARMFISDTYRELNQVEKALEIAQSLLPFQERHIQDNREKIHLLNRIGLLLTASNRHDEAITSFQEALDLARKDYPQYEITSLQNIGNVYSSRELYLQALEVYLEVLALNRQRSRLIESGDPDVITPICSGFSQDGYGRESCLSSIRYTESTLLNNVAVTYHQTGQYAEAIRAYEDSLEISRQQADRRNQAKTIQNLGAVYLSMGQYEQALALTQESIDLAKAVGDQAQQAYSLNALGRIYSDRGQYPQAIETYAQALDLARSIPVKRLEASILGNWAIVLHDQGDLPRALELHQQAQDLTQEAGQSLATSLNNIGLIYSDQGRTEEAQTALQKSLEITQANGQKEGEATALGNLASFHAAQARYAQALELQQEAFEIHQSVGAVPGEIGDLLSLSSLYRSLGQYDRALDYANQALSLSRKINNQRKEIQSLAALGTVSLDQEHPSDAMDYYQQALRYTQSTGEVANESRMLRSIAYVHQKQKHPEKGLPLLRKALAIQEKIGLRSDIQETLYILGLTYQDLGQPQKAQEALRQSVAIAQELQETGYEARSLSSLGNLVAKDQPEVAIAFLKSAVNLTEQIRKDLRSLSREEQESFTQTVSDRYRSLADLLIAQGRLGEAQQVLELLKLEELREFARDTRATWTSDGIQMTPLEQEIVSAHGSLVALGQKIYSCEQIRCDALKDLYRQQEALVAQYNEQVKTFETTVRDNRYRDQYFNDPSYLSDAAREIVETQPGTLLIYPFVTEDRLWLLWTGAGGVVGQIEVPVSQEELGQTVLAFRELIQQGKASSLPELQAKGQQLYGWLIAPLAGEIQKNQIQHLVFAQDRVTRYLPMAALYDGDRYLIEDYTVSTVLSAELTDTRDRLSAEPPSVLGLGLSQAVSGFNPLPYVTSELKGVIRQDPTDSQGIYPGEIFLNQAFDFETMRDRASDHRVLHIATHAKFEPGAPEASYLLLGNGDPLKITDINTIGRQLRDVHLVVLSACETALGGPAADGTEIAGISAYFLEKGRAKSVMASLWAVNDASTSLLMQLFYDHLAQPSGAETMTKAEALRQAQLSLLHSDSSLVAAAKRSSLQVQARDASEAPKLASFQHPYYWSPFTLIGNSF